MRNALLQEERDIGQKSHHHLDLQEPPKSGEKQEPEVAPGRGGPVYSTLM